MVVALKPQILLIATSCFGARPNYRHVVWRSALPTHSHLAYKRPSGAAADRSHSSSRLFHSHSSSAHSITSDARACLLQTSHLSRVFTSLSHAPSSLSHAPSSLSRVPSSQSARRFFPMRNLATLRVRSRHLASIPLLYQQGGPLSRQILAIGPE